MDKSGAEPRDASPAGKQHKVDLHVTAGTRATLRADRSRSFPTPAGGGGAILGGLILGYAFGPIAAIPGFFVGLAAGEWFERRAFPSTKRAEPTAPEQHGTVV